MKLFNLICCLVFILLGASQYNDPEPYIWIPVYLYAALLCWLAFRNKFYPETYLIGITLYAVYAVYLFLTSGGVLDWIQKHDTGSASGKSWMEATGGLLGLLMLIAVLLVNYFYMLKAERSRRTEL